MIFSLNSSAVTSVETDGDIASITFVGGRQYDYTVNNIQAFTSALTEVITKEESVGSFINKSIRSDAFDLIGAA